MDKVEDKVESVHLDKKLMIESVKNSRVYKENNFSWNKSECKFANKFETKVRVIEGDCVDTAIFFSAKNSGKVAILNNASASNPGGGYEKGSASQEEHLCRVSSLFHCLQNPYQICPPNFDYPLPDLGGVYSPNVFFFRSGESKGYSFLPHPVLLNVVSVSGVRSPNVENKGGNFIVDNLSFNLLTKKVRVILEMALQNGNECIIISAFSCGVYGCPPSVVAQIFKNVLKTYEGCFESVVFSLIEDNNSFKDHNPEGNVLPFSKVFGVPVCVIDEEEGIIEKK